MSFTVAPGEVTGFAGPSGAGKSTTMLVILRLDAAETGSARLCGRPYASLGHLLSHVGTLRAASAPQPGRSGRNHLLWLAHPATAHRGTTTDPGGAWAWRWGR